MKTYLLYLVATDGSPEKWRRNCKVVKSSTIFGCSQHDFGVNGNVIVVDECVCDTDLCNKIMGPIPETTSTTQTTTTPSTTTSNLHYMNK